MLLDKVKNLKIKAQVLSTKTSIDFEENFESKDQFFETVNHS